MYKTNSILALITARGGSVGIPKKNIKMLGDKPLIAWSINAAKKSKYIDRLVLSSEDHEIISVAQSYGCDVPFRRPEELAQNETPSMPVILHAISALVEKYDYLLLLQPTSPFRTTKQIDEIIELCIENKAHMAISVKRSSKHPSAMFEISKENILEPFMGNLPNQRRQDAPAAYEHNGALYCSKISTLIEAQSFNIDGVHPYVMEGYSNIDIDEPEDFQYAQYLVASGKVS